MKFGVFASDFVRVFDIGDHWREGSRGPQSSNGGNIGEKID